MNGINLWSNELSGNVGTSNSRGAVLFDSWHFILGSSNKKSLICMNFSFMPTSGKLTTSAKLASKLATRGFFNCALPYVGLYESQLFYMRMPFPLPPPTKGRGRTLNFARFNKKKKLSAKSFHYKIQQNDNALYIWTLLVTMYVIMYDMYNTYEYPYNTEKFEKKRKKNILT